MSLVENGDISKHFRFQAQRDLESGKSHSPARSSRSNTPRTSTPVSRTSTPLRGAGTAKQREMKRKRPTASAMAADVRRSTRPRRAARYTSGSTSHDDSFVSAEGSEGGRLSANVQKPSYVRPFRP